MKELKKIVLFSFLLLAFFMDSFADAEWQQNGAREYYNVENVVGNDDEDGERQQNGSWEQDYNSNEHEDYYDENDLLQNGASELNYNDVESEAVDSDSWKNIIDGDKEGAGVGGDNFNNGGGHVMPEMRSAKKPHILLIMADDVGQGDIEYYWKSGLVQMPNIKELGATGVTFYDTHSAPYCAPSRYMLLSGNYAHRGELPGGTWDIIQDQNQFLKYQKSIAEALKQGGNYATSMYGKWHIGGKIPLTKDGSLNKTHIITAGGHDWTQALIDGPQSIGFDNSFITSEGIQRHPYSFFRDGYLTADVSDAVWWEKKSYTNTAFGESIVKFQGEGDPAWDSTKYNQILVNETEAFLDKYLAKGSTDPFFTYVALGAVHIPHSPPYTYLDGTKIAGTYKSNHMDMLFEMDKVVGSLVSMIDERGLAEDTIIIFTSDNGGLKGKSSSQYGHNSHGPFRGAKGDVYEGGTRVPMILRYKGNFPANEARWNLVGLQDLYATICELAGVDIPDRSARDSLSFAEYIYNGKAPSPRKWQASWLGLTKSTSIRKGMLKLVRHLQPSTTTELYNLAEDISESNNIAFNATYRTLKKQMLKYLRKTGPCPGRDRQKDFELKGGYWKGKMVNCAWFKRKPWKCKEYPEGEVYCSSLCNRFNC